MTKIDLKRDSAAAISSTMPSAKYSCSGSPERLANGRIAIEGLLGSSGSAVAEVADASPALTSSAMLAATLRQPGWSAAPVQPARSAYWIVSNGIGNRDLSVVTWTSFRSSRARLASDSTHSDRTASADQITTAALAAVICSSITRL